MHTFLRILAAVFMIALIAWGNWWLILIAAIVFLFLYETYYEIILWGICCDALYGLPPSLSPRLFNLFNMSYLATLISIALLFLGIFLKKRLTFYS
jgi:hypothetical protein